MIKERLSLLEKNNDNTLNSLLYSCPEQIILDVNERLQADQNNGKESLLSPELMAFSYTGALLNILRWWIGHKEQMSKEEIVAQIQKIFDKLYTA